MDDIREISGYARDKRILSNLKMAVSSSSFVPECLVIYSKDDGVESLFDILEKWQEVNNFVKFYSLGVKLPTE